MKTGLVLEGGAFRTIYSCGVCDALLDKNVPLPDYFLGVSGGAAYGVSYLSKQSRRNLQLLTQFANDPKYIGMKNLLDRKNRCYFGLDYSYRRIPNELLPFDYDTFRAYPGTAEAVVTNKVTGQAEYLPIPVDQVPNRVLEATCAIPLMFPDIVINGRRYLDGGIADAVPWKHALEQGVDRLVVVLTRERDYRKDREPATESMALAFRKYPVFAKQLKTRGVRYNACRDELFELEAQGKVLVLAPDDTLGCRRMERDTEVLRGLWQKGYFDGFKRAEEIRAFWEK